MIVLKKKTTKWLYFYNPTIIWEFLLQPHLHLIQWNFLIFVKLEHVKWNLVVLICISMITNEDEYIFIYLWNVWVSSTVRSLFKFSCCFYTAVLLYPCVSWSSNIFVHIYEHCGYIHAKLYTLLYFCAEVWIIPLECNLLIFFSTTKSKHWYFIFHFLSSFYLDMYICFFFKCLVFPFIF